MGMTDDLKRVQETRVAGKETSEIDPGPFADITPLEKPEEEKAAEKEPTEEEQKEEKEKKESEKPEESDDDDDEEIAPEKIEATLKKYKTPEEAAKAAYNAQKRMHAATSEAARLKKENDDLRRERQSYPPSPPPVERKPEVPIEDAIADKFYAEIERLPEDAPERDKKVVKIMARMNAEISEATRQASDRKSSEIDQHIKSVETRAKELGLDDDLIDDFWIYAGNAPKHLQRDEAIQWTLDRLNRLKGNEEVVKEETLEKVRKDEKEKKRMAPLGKGGAKPVGGKQEEDRNLSLGEALREVSRQRVHR